MSQEAGARTGHTSRTSRKVALGLGATLFLTMVPVTMVVPVLKELLVDRLGATAFWAHSFMSLNLIGAVAATPVIAALADRGGRRVAIAVAALVADASLLATMAWLPTLPLMLAARFFEGAAHMLAVTTLMAVGADSADPRFRGRMMGVVGAAIMFGTAAGTRLGGVVWRIWPGHVLEVAAATGTAAAMLAAFALHDAPSRRPVARLRELRQILRRVPELAVPYAYAFIDRFCVGVVISTFVLYLASVHGLDPDARSRLLAMFLGPFAILVYPAGRLCDRLGRVWPLALGSMGFGLVYMTYGFVSVGVLPWMMVASGVLSAFMFSPNLTLCADLTPESRRGTAYAGFNAAGSLGFLCGPLLGGALVTWLTDALPTAVLYSTIFVITGATEVLCAVVTLPWLVRLRRRGRTR